MLHSVQINAHKKPLYKSVCTYGHEQMNINIAAGVVSAAVYRKLINI